MKKGILNTILTAIVFVTLEPVSKIIAGDVNSYAITLWRFLIGSLVLLPFAIAQIKREKLHISAGDAAVMTLLGVVFVCVSMPILQYAVEIAETPSVIAIVFSSNSVFTVMLAVPLLKDKMTWQKWCTVVMCAIGVLVCVDFKSGVNIESVLFALLAAVCFSLYSVLAQRFNTKLGSLVQTTFVFSVGSIILLIFLILGGIDISVPLDAKNISILSYLGIIVTGIGYWSYFKAIEKGGAVMGSLAFFIKPVLTPFATFAINGIVPDIKDFIAAIFIVCGTCIAVYKKK